MKKHNSIPPALAQKTLVFFLRDDLAEEALGDADEKFSATLKAQSLFKAERSALKDHQDLTVTLFVIKTLYNMREMKNKGLIYL